MSYFEILIETISSQFFQSVVIHSAFIIIKLFLFYSKQK
jgi:hypothetical protein